MLPKDLKALRHPCLALIGLAVIVQFAHMYEHVLQVVQQFLWLQPHAHGLGGHLLDVEPVHLAFNGGILVLAALAYMGARRHGEMTATGVAFAWSFFALQGYHTFEHVVRIGQWLGAGGFAIGHHAHVPGILGLVIPSIWVHFFLNAVVTGLIVGMLLGFDVEAVLATHAEPADQAVAA